LKTWYFEFTAFKEYAESISLVIEKVYGKFGVEDVGVGFASL